MGDKRVYWQTVLKWGTAAGVTGVSAIALLLMFLTSTGAITVLNHTGDSVCAGTIDDPCIAMVYIEVKNTTWLMPLGYDPWGRDYSFGFDPAVKSWKLYREWGNGWREIDLTKSCTGTWCGCGSDSCRGSYKLKEGWKGWLRIEAFKNNPTDDVKWGMFGLDPMWYGVDVPQNGMGITEIHYRTWEITHKKEDKDIRVRTILTYNNTHLSLAYEAKPRWDNKTHAPKTLPAEKLAEWKGYPTYTAEANNSFSLVSRVDATKTMNKLTGEILIPVDKAEGFKIQWGEHSTSINITEGAGTTCWAIEAGKISSAMTDQTGVWGGAGNANSNLTIIEDMTVAAAEREIVGYAAGQSGLPHVFNTGGDGNVFDGEQTNVDCSEQSRGFINGSVDNGVARHTLRCNSTEASGMWNDTITHYWNTLLLTQEVFPSAATDWGMEGKPFKSHWTGAACQERTAFHSTDGVAQCASDPVLSLGIIGAGQNYTPAMSWRATGANLYYYISGTAYTYSFGSSHPALNSYMTGNGVYSLYFAKTSGMSELEAIGASGLYYNATIKVPYTIGTVDTTVTITPGGPIPAHVPINVSVADFGCSGGEITAITGGSLDFWTNYTDTYGVQQVELYDNAIISAATEYTATCGVDETAPTWDQTPTDQLLYQNHAFNYTVNATDETELDVISINDTTNFKITLNGSVADLSRGGAIENNTLLLEGAYSLNISANDTIGNTLSQIITITVTTHSALLFQRVEVLSYNNTWVRYNHSVSVVNIAGQTLTDMWVTKDDNVTAGNFTISSLADNAIFTNSSTVEFTREAGDTSWNLSAAALYESEASGSSSSLRFWIPADPPTKQGGVTISWIKPITAAGQKVWQAVADIFFNITTLAADAAYVEVNGTNYTMTGG